MESIIKSDVFFFITGISVLLLTLFSIVVLFYALRVLRDLKKVTKVMKEEGVEVVKGLASLRFAAMAKGIDILEMLVSKIPGMKKKKAKKSEPKEEDQTNNM